MYFYQQQTEIPEWFLQMRRDVWESLHMHVGQPVTPELCTEIQEKVNALIDGWEEPVTFKGQIVKSVVIDPSGKVQLIF